MSRNSIRTNATPEAVFAVLDNACAYPRWVVGARRIRGVDDDWPAVGSKFHHALGNEVAELHDSSKVLEHDPPRRMVLEVRFRPTGVARVDIQVSTDTAGTIITIDERPTDGPAAWLPLVVVDPLLCIRNTLSLWRLRREVERTPQIATAP